MLFFTSYDPNSILLRTKFLLFAVLQIENSSIDTTIDKKGKSPYV